MNNDQTELQTFFFYFDADKTIMIIVYCNYLKSKHRKYVNYIQDVTELFDKYSNVRNGNFLNSPVTPYIIFIIYFRNKDMTVLFVIDGSQVLYVVRHNCIIFMYKKQ